MPTGTRSSRKTPFENHIVNLCICVSLSVASFPNACPGCWSPIIQSLRRSHMCLIALRAEPCIKVAWYVRLFTVAFRDKRAASFEASICTIAMKTPVSSLTNDSSIRPCTSRVRLNYHAARSRRRLLGSEHRRCPQQCTISS